MNVIISINSQQITDSSRLDVCPSRATLEIGEVNVSGAERSRCRHSKKELRTLDSVSIVGWYPEEKLPEELHPAII